LDGRRTASGALRQTDAIARHIDVSRDISAGRITCPGLPVPDVADHISRDAAEQIYGPCITFQIGLVTMCTNTGTYLNVPFHRLDCNRRTAGSHPAAQQ
jgi:arylformamidase